MPSWTEMQKKADSQVRRLAQLSWPKGKPAEAEVIAALAEAAPLFGAEGPRTRAEAEPLLLAVAAAAQDMGMMLTLPPRSNVDLAVEIRDLISRPLFRKFLQGGG